jgi:membrane-associated phospholipid phosphatase
MRMLPSVLRRGGARPDETRRRDTSRPLDAITEPPPTPPEPSALPVRVARELRRMGREWLLPSRTMRRHPVPPALGLLYIVAIGALGGLGIHHVLLGLLGLLDVYNERTRDFLRTFFPMVLVGVLFDSMRYYYWQGIDGRVHVAEPYWLERAWFGIGGRTLNELFLEHHWPALDLACGFAYIAFAAEYVGLALLMYVRGRADAARTFSWAFLFVNATGFATYFVYPAAPPWWVNTYGLDASPVRILPGPAATVRFDALVGTHLFQTMYGNGIDVFGAYPSLHVAYPFIALVLAFRYRELRWARVPAVAFFLLMCLSAVYLQHHYVTDAVLGVAYSIAAVVAAVPFERSSAARRGAGPPGAGAAAPRPRGAGRPPGARGSRRPPTRLRPR